MDLAVNDWLLCASQKWKALKMCLIYLLFIFKNMYLASTYAIVDWQRRLMCKPNKKQSEIAVKMYLL